ncbi:MAG TPA: aminomethyl-transferring glycine dehydrogenase subunit GcvPA [Thermoclostridium sp.]|nr:aminomethyl-transferring glycine dehydrogenase subunit GcvPA [Clostridiaceae bacterium]HOQ75267.1 aminomethyl-transferring glycine dehydrogenase subunit GcvPA [Thermoclostridium sp.]HPU45189.1 aminomethyl-transferring glycine dehydrogenase subunit GcvPA [Thermoclostridium sp.]
MHRYIPNTGEQREEMLREIGVSGIEELFADIPGSIRLKRELDLPEALSEMELVRHLKELAGRNISTDEYTCFLGAGAYDHYIPSVVQHLVRRQEFYTAYTPYQPEISQGTLQAIFEYQTMICSLTGMDVSNASMYDGATAVAESAAMACRATGRAGVIVARTVHPQSREVLKTYFRYTGRSITEWGHKDGRLDPGELERLLSDDTAAVIVQNPNFFGLIEDIGGISDMVHNNGSLLIVSCNPISLALLKPPGDLGADIAVGEGQPLGNPLSFGGPYLGFMAAKEKFMRKMPGRIAGETRDRQGRRGYVLTIQTREQHIRREKATSNICSNHALNALAAAVYLSALGKNGLKKVAELCCRKARYAYDGLLKTGAFSPAFPGPFFNEFTVRYHRDIDMLNDSLLEHRIIGGYPLERDYPELKGAWLVAVTEKRTRQEIDNFVERAGSL